MPEHVLSIDVEDWFHVENLRRVIGPESWDQRESRLRGNMERILALLARHDVRATFFVLGCAVEKHPSVVREVVEAGHELACHGWSHDLIYRQTPELFREETRRSKALLEDQGGCEVRGAVHGHGRPSDRNQAEGGSGRRGQEGQRAGRRVL